MSVACSYGGAVLERYIFVFILLIFLNCGTPPTDLTSKTGLHLIPATGEEVLEAIENAGAKVVLVNAWATWCQPCVEEFPDIMAVHQKYKNQGLKLILISADFENQADDALAFLKKQGVDFPTYLKSGKDMAFINTLDPNWSGALPATWIYDSKGNKRHFWQGKTSREKFEKKILDVLTN